jgi:Putative DNA-binding domain
MPAMRLINPFQQFGHHRSWWPWARTTYEAIAIGTEAHARRASEAVNDLYRGAPVLSPDRYWEIVKHNSDVLISIVDERHRMVGFFDVFPVRDKPAQEFLDGRSTEQLLLTPGAILPRNEAKDANYIYIGTLCAFKTKHIKHGVTPTVLLYSMITPFIKFLRDKYPPRDNRIFFALAASFSGTRWLQSCGFHEKTLQDFHGKMTAIWFSNSTELWRAQRSAKKLKHPQGYPLVSIRCRWGASILPGIESSSSLAESEPRISAEELVAQGEGHGIEFKSTLRVNLHTGQNDSRMEQAVLKTIAAFVNTNGGNLIIGVSDNGASLGIQFDKFPNEDKMHLHLVNLIRDRIGPQHMMHIQSRFDNYNGVRVLVIDCKKGRLPLYVKEGGGVERFYARTGPATTELYGSQMQDFIKSRFE